jgi:hypothetical protein
VRGRLNSHVKAKSGSSASINKVRNSLMAEMDAPELNIIPDNRGTHSLTYLLTYSLTHLLTYSLASLGITTIANTPSPRTASSELGPGRYICVNCSLLNDSTVNPESTLACYSCAFRKGGKKNI